MSQKNPVLFVAPACLVALASYVVVKDVQWGYSWQFTRSASFNIYVIATVILAVNLFSKRLGFEPALWARRATFALIALVASWVYEAHAAGARWIVNQTAVDVAGNLEGAQLDKYWATYTSLFGDTAAFGGIRSLYEAYGPGLLLNDQTIFLDAINGAREEDVVRLLAAVDVTPRRVPVGYLLILICSVGQAVTYFVLKRSFKGSR